jgi:hypothetical protein
MGRQQNSAKLIKVPRSIHWRDGPMEETDDNQRLVDSSVALRMVVYLHQTSNIYFREQAINRGDLRSMGIVIDIMARSTAL